MNSNSSSSASRSVEMETLDFWTCVFLDAPEVEVDNDHWELKQLQDKHHIDLDLDLDFTSTSTSTSTPENVTFYECRSYGKYLLGSGGVTHSNDSSFLQFNGHFLCVLIWVLILVVGLFGVVTNILNIIILPRSHQGSTLKDMLIILAITELIVCFSTIIFSYLVLSILENLNRSRNVYQWFRVWNIIVSLSRTSSIYVTILATIERYIVVVLPVHSKILLSPTKCRVYLVLVQILSFVLNTSIICNATVSTVDENDVFPVHSHVENFPFIFKDTHFTNQGVNDLLVVLNYVAPFPLLLLFNALLYKSIYNWNKHRIRLSGHQRTEVHAAKMFSIIVFILLSCHTMACIIFFLSRFRKLIYRELLLVQFLSLVLGASVNLVVYYILGSRFKTEFHQLIAQLIKRFNLSRSRTRPRSVSIECSN